MLIRCIVILSKKDRVQAHKHTTHTRHYRNKWYNNYSGWKLAGVILDREDQVPCGTTTARHGRGHEDLVEWHNADMSDKLIQLTFREEKVKDSGGYTEM